MGYTTQALIEAYRGTPLTAEEGFTSKMVIDAVTEWIDHECGQSFQPSPPGTTRYFDGGGAFLFIDPLLDLESIEHIDQYGTVLQGYGAEWYLPYPLNGKTITRIKKRYGCWPGSSGSIAVTGKWGVVGGTPPDVQLAATILACDWFNLDIQSNALSRESIEGYERWFRDTAEGNPRVASILQSHRRILL